jgi:E3 SUMO-protein ligase RanBP2
LAFGTKSTTIESPLNKLITSTTNQSQNQKEIGETADNNDDNGDGTANNPEDFVPHLDFKPLVKLSEVEVSTGEEDDDIVFKSGRCRLFKLVNGEWKEKGVGEIKILSNRSRKQARRIVMRREQVFKLCANHKISSSMSLKELAPKNLSWMAVDFSGSKEGTNEVLLLKFKTTEESDEFKKEFQKSVQIASTLTPSKSDSIVKPTTTTTTTTTGPSLSDQFKTNDWKCTACYASNKINDLKCACCSTAKPGQPQQQPQQQQSTITSQNQTPNKPVFSFGLQNNGGIKPSPSFGQTSTVSNASTKSLFGSNNSIAPKFDFNSSKSPSKIDSSPKTTTPFAGFTGFSKLTTPVTNTPTTTSNNAPLISGNLFQTKEQTPLFSTLAETSKNSPFSTTGGGGFTALKPATIKPLFGASSFTTPPTNNNNNNNNTTENDDDGNNENPEDYEPQFDFKPLVKLEEVEVKTGEENEDVIFKCRCKLFRFDSDNKEWKEKGVGDIKILKSKTSDSVYRILMRRDQVLKLCCNHRITNDIKPEISNEKQVRWQAEDYSEGVSKHELLAAKFKNESDAKLFCRGVEDAQQKIKEIQNNHNSKDEKAKVTPKPATTTTTTTSQNSLSDIFNKKNDSWNCTGCYAPNKNSDLKCACCSAVKPGATLKESESKDSIKVDGILSKTTSSEFSFGKPISGSNPPSFTSASSLTNLINSNNNNNKDNSKITFGTAPISSPFSFGSPAPAPTPATSTSTSDSKNLFATATSVFGSKPGMSFSDLAQNTKPLGFSGGFANAVSGAPTTGSLFSAFKQNNNDNDENADGNCDGNPEEYEPQVDFKPLVKLEEVEVKTGEENEEVLFKQRVKLYRFSAATKEWKEKGVGEMKILKSKEKENSYRVLMRRDQVFKLCANHRITSDIKLENINEKQLRWLVQDCSEGEPAFEQLAAKFHTANDAKEFRRIFEQAQTEYTATSPTKNKVLTDKSNESNQITSSSLADNFKKDKGSWTCNGCYVTNKPDTLKCIACQSEKVSLDDSNKDNNG